MPLFSSKGLFKTGLFVPGVYVPGLFRGPIPAVVPPPAPAGLPGLGGGVSPGFDFEGLLNQFGSPPSAWLAPPAPPVVSPIITDYVGAGVQTVALTASALPAAGGGGGQAVVLLGGVESQDSAPGLLPGALYLAGNDGAYLYLDGSIGPSLGSAFPEEPVVPTPAPAAAPAGHRNRVIDQLGNFVVDEAGNYWVWS